MVTLGITVRNPGESDYSEECANNVSQPNKNLEKQINQGERIGKVSGLKGVHLKKRDNNNIQGFICFRPSNMGSGWPLIFKAKLHRVPINHG